MQWKLTLAYDGSGFHGWQVQPGLRTVQGTLAEVIRATFGEEVLPQGSGRTDTGVHALAQVCSFPLHADVPEERLMRALNRVLPAAVRVLAAEVVAESFHARHSVVRKTYEYRLWERRTAGRDGERPCSPFLAPYVWDCRWPLRFDAMQDAARHFVGTQDFTSFAATDADLAERVRREDFVSQTGGKQGNVRTVVVASWARAGEDLLAFQIAGNGFLHHMVRNIVGTLVDVGRGAFDAEDVPRILAAKSRAAAGPTAPAQGLFLHSVEYASEVSA